MIYDFQNCKSFSKIYRSFYGQIENDFRLPSFSVAPNPENTKKKKIKKIKKIFYAQTNGA